MSSLATPRLAKPRLTKRYPGISSALLLTGLLACASTLARDAQTVVAPSHAVVGVQDDQLNPDYWRGRLPDAQRQILSPQAIAEQNRKLAQMDASVHTLETLPAQFSQAEVQQWLGEISSPPTRALYGEDGKQVSQKSLDDVIGNAALDAIPAQTTVRYALVVHRADLRTFPTRLRVFSSQDNTDIDRFQESALFPGAPVLVLHGSRDGAWSFVISPLYAAWIENQYLAEGDRDTVLAYPHKSPALIVTGATVRTVHNPQVAAVSELQLDMGVRVPVLADWPADKPVNGQSAYTSHVIELPIRDANGKLQRVPALLPKTADTAPDYLPLTPANLLGQSFKFLGERYGWGHSYNTRDCSGFVSEVYRSFGVVLPRNTSDQAISPALNRIAFTAADDRKARMKVIASLQVGDLVYIPGHVMMVIGQDNGQTYLIHDTTGITYRSDSGKLVRTSLNAVSVTPLDPLLFNEKDSYVDRITSIQRIRP